MRGGRARGWEGNTRIDWKVWVPGATGLEVTEY